LRENITFLLFLELFRFLDLFQYLLAAFTSLGPDSGVKIIIDLLFNMNCLSCCSCGDYLLGGNLRCNLIYIGVVPVIDDIIFVDLRLNRSLL
jgi:hypothetical protein